MKFFQASGVQATLRDKVKSSLSVPDDARCFFDSRVLAHFENQLEREVDKIIGGLASAPSSLAAIRIPEAIERLLGNRPMVSLRDIEVQVTVKPNENDAENLFAALGDR